jgi:hypothetical protein
MLDEAHQAAGVQAQWDHSQTGDNAPYGVYNGLTLTERQRSQRPATGAGLSARRERVAFAPNFYEDTSTGYKGGAYGISAPTARRCRSTRRGSST